MRLKHFLTLSARRTSVVLATFVFVVLFAMQARPVSAASPSFVRVVHASPDIGTADVFLDGTKVLSNFAFGTITNYVTIPAGPHKVQVALIGKGPGASVITQTLTVQAGVAYTVVGLGTQANALSLQVFIDNNQLATGQAKVRVYHLSPGTGLVNVSSNGNTLINGLSYQQASDYLTLNTGAYTFNVTATQSNTTLPLPETLNANTVTSVFAMGEINGTPQFQLKSAQVAGIPGLPRTGSDPNPAATASQPQPLAPWLIGLLALLAVGVAVGTRGLILVRQNAKIPSHK